MNFEGGFSSDIAFLKKNYGSGHIQTVYTDKSQNDKRGNDKQGKNLNPRTTNAGGDKRRTFFLFCCIGSIYQVIYGPNVFGNETHMLGNGINVLGNELPITGNGPQTLDNRPHILGNRPHMLGNGSSVHSIYHWDILFFGRLVQVIPLSWPDWI